MAIIAGGSAGRKLEVDATLAARASLYPNGVSASGGRYRLVAQTGLATVLSAFTATAGHWAAFRWGSATKTCLVKRVEISYCIIVDFTTRQRLNLTARLARAYTASHTGGTQLTLTGNNGKLATAYQTTALTDFSVATTGDLTAGTHTIDTQPFLHSPAMYPSDGATVHKGQSRAVWEASNSGGPIVLAQNEGLVFANEILMGVAGTMTAVATVDWEEMLNAEVPSGT